MGENAVGRLCAKKTAGTGNPAVESFTC